MSFFDGIVNGFRSALGFTPARGDAPKRESGTEAGRTSGSTATRTPTRFEAKRTPSTSGTAQRPNLAELLRRAAPQTGASSGSLSSLPPHLRAQRGDAVPTMTEWGTPSDAWGAGSDVSSTARAVVYDGSRRDADGGSAFVGDSSSLAGSSDAAVAARNVQAGLDYFSRTFGRNGIDGAGAGVDVVINDHTRSGNGGYYATPLNGGGTHEGIWFGTGTSYRASHGQVDQQAMLHADDLAIHELTHGVIRKETGHLGGHADEAGATNEAVADVIAAAATRDWRIGEKMYTDSSDYRLMRNIADPDDPAAIHGLWTSMDEVRSRQQRGEEVEEHWASGVLSTAAYRVQQRLGGETGWRAVERVFYDTITHDRMGDMTFDEVAQGLRTSAAAAFGEGSEVATALDEELRRAGL